MPSLHGTDTALPMPHNHLSSLTDSLHAVDHASPGSESALSDAVDTDLTPTSPTSAPEETSHEDAEEEDIEVGAVTDLDKELSSSEEEVEVERDGDFDPESPLRAEPNGDHDDGSTSHDSHRPSKRKATAEDDEFIVNNPELYGLRRSVSLLPSELVPKICC